MNVNTIDDIETKGKRVLLRVDFNSPINPDTKKITDSTRIRAPLQTINDLADSKLVIMAHQGRPGSDDFVTLEEHAQILASLVDRNVKYVSDLFGPAAKAEIESMKVGDIILLENTRLYSEEMLKGTPEVLKDTTIVKKLAPLFDAFVNDAFAAVHRSQPSLVGFTAILPSAAGRLMQKEIEMLDSVITGNNKPEIFIIGGAKFEDAVDLVRHVLTEDIADKVLLSGVVGNLFLLGRGMEIGGSEDMIYKNADQELIDKVKKLVADFGRRIETPVDVAVDVDGGRVEHTVNDLPDVHRILDIGGGTIAIQCREIMNAGTIVVNGPPGLFENPNFEEGTKTIFEALAKTKGRVIIGGGHAVAAASKYNVADKVSYISTGGGAMIEYLSGKKMPALEALENAKKREGKGKKSK